MTETKDSNTEKKVDPPEKAVLASPEKAAQASSTAGAKLSLEANTNKPDETKTGALSPADSLALGAATKDVAQTASAPDKQPVSARVEADGSLSFAAAAADKTPINLNNFNAVAKDVIEAVDPSGRATKVELGQAMENHRFKGQDAQVLAALYDNYDQLAKLTQTPAETGKGLSSDDVARLPMANISDAAKMQTWANADFNKFAVNGSLTKSEIDNAIANPNTSSQDAAGLKLLDQYFSKITEGNGSPATAVTAGDINNYLQKTVGSQERGKLYLDMASDLGRTAALGEGADVNHHLYSSSNPIDSIKPDAVTQGLINDCYFDSALAAVAQNNPALIANAIKDNHNGSYTVTFPGAPDEPITVKNPSAAELGLYDGGSQFGTWAPVMEKAFGEYRLAHAQQFQVTNDPANTPEKGADGRGYSTDAMALLTGKPAQFARIDHGEGKQTDSSSIGQFLDTAINKDTMPVTAAVYANDSGHTKNPSLMNNHEYTVVGYKPDDSGSGTVILRNPMGGKNDVIQISLDDFSKDFDGITVSGH